MRDKTDEIRERESDGTVGGTVDGYSDAVLTLDANEDRQPSNSADGSDSGSDGPDSTNADADN